MKRGILFSGPSLDLYDLRKLLFLNGEKLAAVNRHKCAYKYSNYKIKQHNIFFYIYLFLDLRFQ